MKKPVTLGIGTTIVFVIFSTVAASIALAMEPTATASPNTDKPAAETSPAAVAAGERPTGKGMLAVERAAAAEKYLFVFFYNADDDRTLKLREVFEATMLKVADRADSVAVNTTDPLEKEIVDKFDVSRAPMPLALALAPNGAVTRGFPVKFDEKRLMEAFASPCMEKCLKALQDSKITLLCVQNGTTKLNDEAMRGVTEFKADARYGRTAEIVTVDPKDPGEAETLKKFNIDLDTDQAQTALLAPPGRVIGMFKGATTKDMLAAAVRKSASGCDPRSGCCPKKKGATGK